MQKLVTIYLNSHTYSKGKFLSTGAEAHGLVEEHLQDYLQQGWAIKTIHGFGGSSETVVANGWVVVLLEKQGG